MSLLARQSARTYFRRHPGQTALSILGIALGVAVVLAIDLTTSGAERAFELATRSVTGRATHRIVADSVGVDEALYARLRVEHGLRELAPVVRGDVRLLAEDGSRLGAVTVLGVDPLAEAPLRASLGFGTARTNGGSRGLDLAALLTRSGACMVLDGVAWAPGPAPPDDAVQLLVESRGVRSTLQVVSRLAPTDPVVRAGLARVVVVDLATAQEVLGRVGRLDTIDLVLRPEQVERVRSLLPPEVDLQSVEGARVAAGDLTRAFRLNLQALSLLTLLVGAFLVFNTVSFAVVRRRRDLGVLRALGASRRRIFVVVLVEAVVLGLVGTVLGLGLGYALAHGLLDLVTRTIQDHYFTVTVTDVAVGTWQLLAAVGLGLGTCAVAAIAPAWDATRVAPREVLLRTTLETRAGRLVGRGLLVAVGLAAAGVAVLAFGGRSVGVAYVGLFGVLLGAAGLTPLVCSAVAAAARPLAERCFGVVGTHATRGVRRNLSRTAVATAALMLAVATTVGLGTMIQSFRAGVDRWLGSALNADVFVAAPSSVSERYRVRIDADLAARIAALPEVGAAVGYHRFETPGRGLGAGGDAVERVRCIAVEGFEHVLETFEPVRGDAAAIHARARAGDLLVSEPFAYRNGLAAGDRLALHGRDGWVELDIAGVFFDYGSEVGYVVMPHTTQLAHFRDGGVAAFGLFAADGVAPDAVAEAVRLVTESSDQRLTVQTSDALQAASLEVFDRTFAVTAALRGLCILVAFLGIWSALMALQLERRREFGVLRALGATPRQVRALITTQTGLLGLGAGLWALPVGAALGWILIHVVNKRSFGWTLLRFELQGVVLLEALAVAVVAAVLAGWQPARTFGRIKVTEALRED